MALTAFKMITSRSMAEIDHKRSFVARKNQASMILKDFIGSSLNLHEAVRITKKKSINSGVKMTLHKFSNAGNFRDDDDCYVEVSVLETSEVRSTSHGFLIRMTDGREMTCKHAASQTVKLQDSGSQPAIVLRMENGSGILLPIIVMEYPAQQLKECMRKVPVTRPTIYQVMKEMASFMGYELKMVRVTHRVCEAYYARAYLRKVESDGVETIMSLDMKPSDAINLAARAKVPIQVNKALAEGDGVIPLNIDVPPRPVYGRKARPVFLLSDKDKPMDQACSDAKEFAMVRAMTIATMLERYKEAAFLRDELSRFRSPKKMKTKKEPNVQEGLTDFDLNGYDQL